MGVNSISDYSAMFQYYRVPGIPAVNLDQIHKKATENETSIQTESLQTSVATTNAPGTSPNNRANIPLEDVSLTFNSGSDYDYIGGDSDIATLDMKKAISDMKKDQVLMQYQYFVGSTGQLALTQSMQDGVVVLK